MPPLELGLIGYPLGHSLSPVLHKAALRAFQMEGEYRLYPYPPTQEGEADILALIENLRKGQVHGLNVTIPYKQTVMPWLDELTGVARGVGAVNTLICQGGRLVGDNTDVPGFLTDLHTYIGPRPGNGEPALVLGAGGAARAVIYALIQDGWKVYTAARQPDLTLSFPDKMIKTIPLTREGLYDTAPGCRLIINTTPVGMHPDEGSSPWPEGLSFPTGAMVYDLVYNPPVTCLVKQAREAGLPAETGLGMLIEQAALSFEFWTGYLPPVQVMRQAVAAFQEAKSG